MYVRDFSWLEFIMSATDSNGSHQNSLQNFRQRPNKLFHKTKLGKASLNNVKIWDNAQGWGEG